MVARTTVNIRPCMPVVLCAPHLYKSRSKVKERTVWKTADAPASFKYDVWRLFGFPASRNEKGEQMTHRQTTIQRHCWAITNTHLWHFSAHVLAFKVVLINVECAFLSLKELYYSISTYFVNNHGKYCTTGLLQRYYCIPRFWYFSYNPKVQYK